MKIIDAHHHLWAPQSPDLDVGYVWLKDIGAMKPFGDPTPIQRDYLLEEFLAESQIHSLDASVHVQADPRLPDPVAETAFVQKISDVSGHPIMIVGFADLSAGDFEDTLARHRAYPNLRGIRQIISHLADHPELSFAARNLLDDLTWRAQFAALGDHGLGFDLQLYPEQMMQAAAFLADHPGVPVVIDHLGSPYDMSQAGYALWSEGMRALAALPQVHVKLSGYAMFFGADLTGDASRVTQDILTFFGSKRCMFGSNFPVDRLHLIYDDIVDLVLAEVGQDPGARNDVFGDVARKFYRIGPS